MCTFYKLKDGSWGIKGAGRAPAPGARVDVTKASGERSTVTIAAVVAWFPDGNWIASIDKAPGAGGRVRGRCRARGCNGVALASGFCRTCEFDEFDN